MLSVTLARIVYLIAICPYQLVEDEAHYWEWSRRLDWSYYSKGPGVAAVIRAMTELFGHAEWAIRLPAAIAGGVAALCVAGLARDTARHAGVSDTRRVALLAAGAFILAPMFQLPAVLMTIDGPYVACWAAASWAAWRAMMRRSPGAWLALGAALGVGFLFKYTIALLVPGLVLYAIVARRRLVLPARAPVWITLSAMVALGGLVPVAVWNAQRDWPTVRHLLGHLGLHGGDVPIADAAAHESKDVALLERLAGSFEFVAAQIGMVGPMLALGIFGWWYVRRWRGQSSPDAETDSPGTVDGAKFLICAALPIIVFYLGVTLIAEAEQNWAMGGYVTLMALAGWTAALGRFDRERTTAPSPPVRQTIKGSRAARRLWNFGVVYGVCAAIILLRLDWFIAALNTTVQTSPVQTVVRVFRGPDHRPQPYVLGRLTGAPDMAQEAIAQLSKIESETGRPGFIMTDHYGRASQMAYYTFRLGDEAEVYCTSALMGGRRTQYDLWPATDITAESVQRHLFGRDAILFSNDRAWKLAQWEEFFRQVEPLGKFPGEHKKDRIAYRGHHYHGRLLNKDERHDTTETTP